MDRLFKSINEDYTSLLYFSEQSYPETIPPENLFKFEDHILHLETHLDKLYIFLEEKIDVLSGSNNLTFILDEFYTDGCFEYTVCHHENIMYFTNEKGIYRFSNSYPELMSGKVQKLFDLGLINKDNVDYAEVLESEKAGDFYVVKLTESISPSDSDLNSISHNEFSRLQETGSDIHNGLDWIPKCSDVVGTGRGVCLSEEAAKVKDRFGIDKIAVCLRTGSIWFGTESDSDEYLWKSSEIVQESFFKLKKYKKMALDFVGAVKTVWTKNRNDSMTYKELPITSEMISAGGRTKPIIKTSKGLPEFWDVDAERGYSHSIIFLSNNDAGAGKNTILYKWEITEHEQ